MNPLDEMMAQEKAEVLHHALSEYARRGQQETENALLLAAHIDGWNVVELSPRFRKLRDEGLVSERSAAPGDISRYIKSALKDLAEIVEMYDE